MSRVINVGDILQHVEDVLRAGHKLVRDPLRSAVRDVRWFADLPEQAQLELCLTVKDKRLVGAALWRHLLGAIVFRIDIIVRERLDLRGGAVRVVIVRALGLCRRRASSRASGTLWVS